MAARFGTADDASTLRAVVSRRTSANGIFGTKAHADQLRAVDLLAPLGPDFLPTKHILLKRRDLDRQAVSLARAVATHRWIDMDGYSHPPPQTVSIEASGLLRTRRHIDAQNAAWSLYFEDRQVEPLTLWYEDVVRNPQDAVDQVAAFLGAPSGPVDAASAPLRIQSDAETDRLTRLLRS